MHTAKKNDDSSVICLRCGLVDDYHVVISGPHYKAVCNGCDRYIKFIPKTQIQKTMANKDDDKDLLPAGLRFFNPHEKAPDFVIGTLLVTMKDFLEYWKKHPELHKEKYEDKEQMKIQILVSKGGKLYGKVDDYEKEEKVEGRVPTNPNKKKAEKEEDTSEVDDDDLPF